MITSPLQLSAFTSIQFSYKIESTNNATHFETSTLPPGLILNRATGYITGAPTIDGNYNIILRAVSALSIDAATLILRINHDIIPSPINAIYFGYNAPFLGGKEAVFSRQTDEKLIRNDLLQLLLTSPGERLYRPDFGSGIRRFLFESITSDAIDSLKQNIFDTIAKHEKRVNATSVNIQVDDNQNLLMIKVVGSMINDDMSRRDKNSDVLISLDLPLTKNNPIG